MIRKNQTMMRNNMRTKYLPLLLSAALLCGCGVGSNAEETAVSESETVTTTVDDRYLLVRNWTGSELLDSIFFCGEYRPLPLKPVENEGFTFSDGYLTFPDGTYMAVETNGIGEVISLRAEVWSAPADLSVYGIGFDSAPEDIYEHVGIPDIVSGDMNGSISYTFFDGGISSLEFVYTDRRLESIYIKR